MRLLNIIYLKETDETCDFIKRFIVKIKKVAKAIDEKCFIVVANAREVLGNGFKE